MRIHFLGIGVQKAGTSTLHDILKQHPQIYLPNNKESHFFDLSENYNKGTDWFFKVFYSKYGGQKFIGKFTPEYMYMEKVPCRIKETYGTDMKFIVVLRNPVDRAVSHYNMIYRRGLETATFWEAIKSEPQKVQASELAQIHFSYLSRGLYAGQLKRYFQIFPKENFLILLFEKDIVKNLPETIARIQNFLGVKQIALDTNVKSNEAYAPKSVKLNRLLRNAKLKQFVLFFLPKKYKKKLKKGVLELNKKEDKNDVFKLTREEKQQVFNTYFYKDVKELEGLLNIDLKDVWY